MRDGQKFNIIRTSLFCLFLLVAIIFDVNVSLVLVLIVASVVLRRLKLEAEMPVASNAAVFWRYVVPAEFIVVSVYAFVIASVWFENGPKDIWLEGFVTAIPPSPVGVPIGAFTVAEAIRQFGAVEAEPLALHLLTLFYWCVSGTIISWVLLDIRYLAHVWKGEAELKIEMPDKPLSERSIRSIRDTILRYLLPTISVCGYFVLVFSPFIMMFSPAFRLRFQDSATSYPFFFFLLFGISVLVVFYFILFTKKTAVKGRKGTANKVTREITN